MDPFASGGVALGGSIHDGPNGFLLGGELSAGILTATKQSESKTGTLLWLGGYADLVRDFGSDTTRLSLGPEVGAAYFGIDGGIVREFGDDPEWGFAIRPVITVGFVAAFVRYTHFGGDRDETSHVEIGVLLKLPYVPGLRF